MSQKARHFACRNRHRYRQAEPAGIPVMFAMLPKAGVNSAGTLLPAVFATRPFRMLGARPPEVPTSSAPVTWLWPSHLLRRLRRGVG
jgi:hypothetical protein